MVEDEEDVVERVCKASTAEGLHRVLRPARMKCIVEGCSDLWLQRISEWVVRVNEERVTYRAKS